MEKTKKTKQPQTHRVCHCGKCKIKCNKHGQKARCADCGKIRVLGTVIEKGQIRYSCGKCCDRLKHEADAALDNQMNELIATLKKENAILDEDAEVVPSQITEWQREEDERCVPE